MVQQLSLIFNAFFLVCFAFLAVLQLLLAIRHKTIVFGVFMVAGCIGEAIGYAGRILLQKGQPIGGAMDLCFLFFSPALVSTCSIPAPDSELLPKSFLK